MSARFCTCNAMCRFEDSGAKAEYVCPVCNKRYDLEPKHTLLYFKQSKDHDASLFNSLLNSGPQDITNMRVDKRCPKCDTPYMTYMQVNHGSQNLHMCWCGYREIIS